MKITGIIAEYNPLHLGHQFHIAKTRELVEKTVSKDSCDPHYIITILSGNYVQRGLPAVIDKHTRARMALEAGSDLVLELPVPYALSSGEGFAFGGVSLLHQLGCVDFLSFGSEDGKLDDISSIAQILYSLDSIACDTAQTLEQETYHTAYQLALKQGLTPPAARLQALHQAYPDLNTNILDGHSNNMLAIEYCKALLRLNSNIHPVTIQRQGQAYLEHTTPDTAFASATAIRKALVQQELDVLISQTPVNVADTLSQAYFEKKLVFADDFSALLHYKLLTLSKDSLTDYLEITPYFANKITKNLPNFESFTQFANLLWTKDTTYARVCRNLMNILLDIKEVTWDVHQPTPYARILGFRKESVPLLSKIKKCTSIPLISKLADAEKLLDSTSYSLLELDIKAAHIYDSIVSHKARQLQNTELQKQIIII